MRHPRLLNLPVGDALPTEFRVFRAGVNATSKGDFLFDQQAAQAVMASFADQGNELMVDYDHASLSAWPVDPALSARAAGWFSLEMRGGDLWAVNVRWTPGASAQLANKEWRYFSPAFDVDEHGRIVSLVNIALTNLPATKSITPLVAASQHGAHMDPEIVQKALDALEAGDTAAALDLLKQLIASAASGGAAPAPEAPVAPEMSAQDAALVAAGRMAVTLTGADSAGAAMQLLSEAFARSTQLAAQEAALAADRAALEGDERKGLVIQLVKLGAETPATAWSDDTASTPCKRLASEPIAELRARVKTLSAARQPKPRVKPPVDPNATGGVFDTDFGPIELSAREVATCKNLGAKPEEYAKNKAAVQAAKAKIAAKAGG